MHSSPESISKNHLPDPIRLDPELIKSASEKNKNTDLVCKILTSESEIERLAESWQNLQQKAGTTPYSSYDAYAAWWKNIGKPKGKTPFVVAGTSNGNLVALLPLSLQVKMGIRFLQGSGAETSHVCDVLAETPEHALKLWETVRESGAFDIALIKNIRADTLSGKYLASFARLGAYDAVPYLTNTWADGKAWLASLHTNIRRNNNRLMRKLQEKGEVHYRVETGAPISSSVLDEMLEHKLKWAKDYRIGGLFAEPGFKPYFHQCAEQTARHGELHFSWLECGGKNVVFSFGFLYKDTLYLKLLSYDPDYLAFSPGNLILVSAIGWAFDHGCKEINLGVGDNHYKLRYSSGTYAFADWIFAGSAQGRVIELAYATLSAMRTLFTRLTTNLGGRLKAMKPKSPKTAPEEKSDTEPKSN